VFFIIAMLVIRLEPSTEQGPKQSGAWRELKDGVHYVRRHQSIRAVLIIIALASVFARGALEMLPAFADAVYLGGSSALAILTSAIGAGAIVSGLILSRGTQWLTIGIVRMAAAAGGLLIAILGLIQDFHTAVGIVVLLGVILSLCGVGSQILVQTLVDNNVRGRVSSIWGMVAFGGTALGGLIIGSAATVWGLQNAVFVSGLVCTGTIMLSNRK
jgi:MFS family permease